MASVFLSLPDGDAFLSECRGREGAAPLSFDTSVLLRACSLGLAVLSGIPADECPEAFGPLAAERLAQVAAKYKALVLLCSESKNFSSPTFLAHAIRLGFCVLQCESDSVSALGLSGAFY